MKRRILLFSICFAVILAAALSLGSRRSGYYRGVSAGGAEGWLGTWAKRVEVTIADTNIDAELTDFPILLYLSSSSGTGTDDLTFIFDELTADANRKKIAVTTSDGETEIYAEIERWDDANEVAWIWTKVPTVSDSGATTLYFYYDSAKSANTTYIGDPTDAVTHNVWNSKYDGVWHMGDDLGSTDLIDSTATGADGTALNMDGTNLVDGKIGKAESFDGTNEGTTHGDIIDAASNTCFSAWVYTTDKTKSSQVIWIKKDAGPVTNYAFYLLNDDIRHRFYTGIWQTNDTGTSPIVSNATWYFVAIRFDSVTQNRIKIWVNANEEYNQQQFNNLVTNDRNFRIGGDVDPASFMEGRLDELRIGTTLRSEAELKAEYYTGSDTTNDYGTEETL